VGGGHTNRLEVILGVAIGMDLDAILVARPCEISRSYLVTELIVDINGGSAVKSSGKRLLGKKGLGSLLKITKVVLESNCVVLVLEGGRPLEVESLEAVDIGILD